jgi:hypothetical protein
MKQVMALALLLTLSAFAAQAQQSSATASAKSTRKRAAQQSDSGVAAQLTQLKQAVDAQQQQIQQLSNQVQSRDQQIQQLQQKIDQNQASTSQTQSQIQEAESKANAAATAASQASDNLGKLQSDVADIRTNTTNAALTAQDDQKKLSALQSAFGRFRFTGDVRVRGETFVQQGTQDRNRARIRVRLGLEGQLNQDFIGGLALATGSMGDPTTTNTTLTNIFDRKTIALDKGYITYNPVAHKWFSATGGKFAYLWQRTPVTGDTDLNPEGFDQKLSFDIKHGIFTNFTLQAIELLYGEVSSGQDSYNLGIQAQTTFKPAPWWSATASFLNQHWNRPDAILQASAFAVGATTTGSTTLGPFPVTGEGPGCAGGVTGTPKFAPCIFAPNGMTNGTTVDSSGKAHFYSAFDTADFILNNTFKGFGTRFPIGLVLEFEENLNARPHPLDTSAKIISSLGAQNKEYGADFSIGQTKNKNDVQFGYAWLRQEQDAVIASIAESDQRAPTNVLQNRVYANWKLRTNTLASFTWWYGRTLNTNLENNAAVVQKTIKVPGDQEPYFTRLQFDLIYTY